MKLKAKIEVEYDVDPEDYSFSELEDRKEMILEFERKVFLVTIDMMCINEPIITAIVVEV